MNIQQIYNEQYKWNSKIVAAAEYINPKLLGVLTLQDLFNDYYADNTLLLRYNTEVSPLIREYKIFMEVETENYLLDFINDVGFLTEHTGYDSSTGEATNTFDSFDEIPEKYIPSLEIEPIWRAVMEMRWKYNYEPYWRKSGYTLSGNNEIIVVESFSSPNEFVIKNREQFNRSFGDTNLGRMERSVLWKNQKFDYPIYIPALRQHEDRSIPASYEESVRRHLILKEMMENQHSDDPAFSSQIDAEGNVTISPVGF